MGTVTGGNEVGSMQDLNPLRVGADEGWQREDLSVTTVSKRV